MAPELRLSIWISCAFLVPGLDRCVMIMSPFLSDRSEVILPLTRARASGRRRRRLASGASHGQYRSGRPRSPVERAVSPESRDEGKDEASAKDVCFVTHSGRRDKSQRTAAQSPMQTFSVCDRWPLLALHIGRHLLPLRLPRCIHVRAVYGGSFGCQLSKYPNLVFRVR